MEEVGPFALIGLAVLVLVAVVAAVLVIVGVFVFGILGATGFLVLKSRSERKRQASEVEPDEAW